MNPATRDRVAVAGRLLLVTGVVVCILVGLAIVAGFVVMATAVSSYGSNK